MTLDRAIEHLAWLKDEAIFPKNQDDINALELGIEAMKSHKKAIAAGWFPPGYKLPGETED